MVEADFNVYSLKGETALITGGATGIGFSIAKSFIMLGAKVVIASRNEQALQKAVTELGPQADYKVHDVTNFDKSEALINSIDGQYGPLTILVNNAGSGLKKKAEETSEEDFLKIYNVHVLGAFSLSRYTAIKMMKNQKGNILFIASMTSLFGVPYVLAYSAAKSAYLGMVRTLATEWSPRGIRVNAIAPGWIETRGMKRAIENDPERKAKVLSRTPMHQFGSPDDIGWTAAFLVSKAARYITGVCIPVDGGTAIGF